MILSRRRGLLGGRTCGLKRDGAPLAANHEEPWYGRRQVRVPQVRRSERVWLAIGGAVLVHNATAALGDTLSERMDEWILAHPMLVRAGIGAVALHLANAVRPEHDPIHWAFVGMRKLLGER